MPLGYVANLKFYWKPAEYKRVGNMPQKSHLFSTGEVCSVKTCSYKVRRGTVAAGKGVMTADAEIRQSKSDHPRDWDSCLWIHPFGRGLEGLELTFLQDILISFQMTLSLKITFITETQME